MNTRISRSRFLRGDLAGRQPIIRPPWSIGEAAFVEYCSRCEDCLRACPEGILVRGRGGFPEVDFRRGECTFCHACAEACRPGVIADQAQSVAWSLAPVIDPMRCLAVQGVVCVTCQEQCEAQAIGLPPQAGGVSRPVIEAARCTGCGACVRPCPGQAIALQPRSSDSHPVKEAHA